MYAKIVLITATILLSSQVHAQSTTPTTAPKASSKKKAKTTTPAVSAPVATPAVEVKKEVTPAPVVEVAPAATTNSMGQEVLKYLKEKFSASYHGEFYFLRRDSMSTSENDHDIQDLKMLHSPTIVYKPTKNWQAMASAEFKYSDVEADSASSYRGGFYRSLVTLTRKNLLVEKDHGVQLDAGVGRRQFYTGPRPLYSSYGNNRIFTTVSKSLNKHNASLFVQYLQNDFRNTPAKPISSATWGDGFELIPTLNFQITEKLTWLINDDIVINFPHFDNNERSYSMTHEMNIGYINYQWNDKLGTYFQLKYYHSEDFTKAYQSNDDWMEYYIGASYSITPKITVTGEIGSEIQHARDLRDGFSKKLEYPELALYLDMSL